MSRIWYISPSHVYEAARQQRCFAPNTNLEIRAAIHAELLYARDYFVAVETRHKHKYEGASKMGWYYKKEDVLVVRRLSQDQVRTIGLNLKFRCPMCGGANRSNKTPLDRVMEQEGEIVCEDCWSADFRNITEQLRSFNGLIKALQRGYVSDEEYSRLTEHPDSGFDQLARWEHHASGGEGEGIPCEEHYRHAESGGSSECYALGQVPAGLAATAAAITRRSEITLAVAGGRSVPRWNG